MGRPQAEVGVPPQIMPMVHAHPGSKVPTGNKARCAVRFPQAIQQGVRCSASHLLGVTQEGVVCVQVQLLHLLHGLRLIATFRRKMQVWIARVIDARSGSSTARKHGKEHIEREALQKASASAPADQPFTPPEITGSAGCKTYTHTHARMHAHAHTRACTHTHTRAPARRGSHAAD